MLLDMKTRKARELFKRQRNLGFADAILGRDYDQPGGFYILGAKGFAVFLQFVARLSAPADRFSARVTGEAMSASGMDLLAISGVVLKLKDAEGDWHDVSGLLDREARVLAKPTKNTNRYYILMLPQSTPAADDPGLRHVLRRIQRRGNRVVRARPSEVATVLMDFKGEDFLVRYQDESVPPLIFNATARNLRNVTGSIP